MSEHSQGRRNKTMSEPKIEDAVFWLEGEIRYYGEPEAGYIYLLLDHIAQAEADSKRLDKLERMSPATLGEVLCRLAKPSAKVRDVIDKLEEQDHE